MKNKPDGYTCFLEALSAALKKEGHGAKTSLSISVGITLSHLSQISNNKKKASFETQEAIANALGYDYIGFLTLGRKLIEGEVEETGLKDPNDAYYVEAVTEILNSPEVATKEALRANIRQFHEQVKDKQELREMRGEMREMKKKMDQIEKENKILKISDPLSTDPGLDCADARKRWRSGCAFDGTHNRLSSASGRLSGCARLEPDLRSLPTGGTSKMSESDEKSCF